MADAVQPGAHRGPLKLQVLDKMNTLMTAALGLVAALAWNAAIMGTFAEYVPAGSQLRALFVYAILVTLLAVLLSLWIAAAFTRVRKRVERHEERRDERRREATARAPPPGTGPA